MRPRIIIFPGMGADARLIGPQRVLDVDFETPAWIEPVLGESLAEYARRVAGLIDQSSPFYLGGISFGGMVAQEVARHVSPLGLILIASCRRGTDLGIVRRGVLRSSCITPNWAVQCAKRATPLLRPIFNCVDPAHGALLSEMLQATSPRFLKWSMQAILDWPGCEINCPLLHIHGSSDKIIPISGLSPTHTIANAGHVLNLTHAEEVNAVIANWLQRNWRSTEDAGLSANG